MNKHPLFIILILLITVTALLSAVLLTLSIILGYSGFSFFNYQANLISLVQDCKDPYFSAKYSEQTLEIAMRITFVCAFLSLIFSFIAVCLIILALNDYCKKESEESQQTGIEHFFEGQSDSLQKMAVLIQNPLQAALYILITLTILNSLLVFQKYLQFHQQSKSSTCRLTIFQSHIIQITILSGLIMSFAILALFLFIIIVCKINRRLQRLNKQNANHSLSFKNQIQRIIREIPESQRRMTKSQDATPYNDLKYEQRKEVQGKQREIFEIPKIQSIIYNVSPSLMLQSVVN